MCTEHANPSGTPFRGQTNSSEQWLLFDFVCWWFCHQDAKYLVALKSNNNVWHSDQGSQKITSTETIESASTWGSLVCLSQRLHTLIRFKTDNTCSCVKTRPYIHRLIHVKTDQTGHCSILAHSCKPLNTSKTRDMRTERFSTLHNCQFLPKQRWKMQWTVKYKTNVCKNTAEHEVYSTSSPSSS